MKLFEADFILEWNYFIRVYDTETKKSESISIPSKYEYFKPISSGSYTYLLDENIKMAKYLGSRKDAEGNFGVRRPNEHYIRDHFWREHKFNMNPRVFYLDIETRTGQNSTGVPNAEDALEEITLIQIFDSVTNSMIVLGTRDFVDHYDKLKTLEYPVSYKNCGNEINLLNTFYNVFKALDPLIIYAWNGANFDFPYLYYRTAKLGLDPNRLSNYGNVTVNYVTYKGARECRFRSCGHFFIDMIEVYKKITVVNKPSYSLEYISQAELKQGKVDHSEFATFDSFYTGKDYIIRNEPYDDEIREEIRQLKIKGDLNAEEDKRLTELLQFQFVFYGVKDVYLLKLLDKKRNLTNILCAESSTMGVNFMDTLGTLKPWGTYLLNTFYEEKVAGPIVTYNEDDGREFTITGGFVRDPVAGRHEWVISEDVNSMYPLLSMVGFNMSPETFIPLSKAPPELREHIMQYYYDQDEIRVLDLDINIKKKTIELLEKYNLSMGINGALFRRDKVGTIPKLVLDIYLGRKKDKKTMLKYDQIVEKCKELLKNPYDCESQELKDPLEYENIEELKLNKADIESLMSVAENKSKFYNTEQFVKKILINSLYGALGNKNFVLFNEKIAQAITGNGRYFIRMTANNMERRLQAIHKSNEPYVVYGDTDSFYTQVGPIMNKYIAEHPEMSLNDYVDYADSFELAEMQPIVQKSIELLAKLFNACKPDVIGMKRENIMPAAIFVAKKKYFAAVMDSEGTRYPEDDPHIKVMGLELARATTPNWCKDYLSRALKFILNNDPSKLPDWINGVMQSFKDADIRDLALNGSAKSVQYNLSEKSIPWMSKAAVYHNKFVKENKLEDKINLVKDGEKCKILFLTTPNKFGTDKIAYISDNILPYVKDIIDYDTTFEKVFINPLQNIMNALNVDLKKTTIDLEDW